SAEDLWGSLTQCAPFDKLRATLGDGVLSFSGHRMVAAGIGNEWKACCLLSASADTDIGPNLRDEWQIVMRTKVGATRVRAAGAAETCVPTQSVDTREHRIGAMGPVELILQTTGYQQARSSLRRCG